MCAPCRLTRADRVHGFSILFLYKKKMWALSSVCLTYILTRARTRTLIFLLLLLLCCIVHPAHSAVWGLNVNASAASRVKSACNIYFKGISPSARLVTLSLTAQSMSSCSEPSTSITVTRGTHEMCVWEREKLRKETGTERQTELGCVWIGGVDVVSHSVGTVTSGERSDI